MHGPRLFRPERQPTVESPHRRLSRFPLGLPWILRFDATRGKCARRTNERDPGNTSGARQTASIVAYHRRSCARCAIDRVTVMTFRGQLSRPLTARNMRIAARQDGRRTSLEPREKAMRDEVSS
ncbi:uncharacterized protein LOC143902901 [Temnothorax americanus]|uniref:uncharacterized protein LOC143902901 n=1 Tax=Temnothorax americanus TaxID=1964332 RepID=UPI004068A7C2